MMYFLIAIWSKNYYTSKFRNILKLISDIWTTEETSLFSTDCSNYVNKNDAFVDPIYVKAADETKRKKLMKIYATRVT